MRNNHSFRFAVALAVFSVTASTGRSAQAPLTPEELKAKADNIVTGIVKKVTSEIRKNPNGGGTTDRHYKITLTVATVEKGKLKPGKKIVLLAWKPHKRPLPFPGPQGHSNIPEKGKTIRVFLRGTSKKGGHKVIHPNGFQDTGAAGKH